MIRRGGGSEWEFGIAVLRPEACRTSAPRSRAGNRFSLHTRGSPVVAHMIAFYQLPVKNKNK